MRRCAKEDLVEGRLDGRANNSWLCVRQWSKAAGQEIVEAVEGRAGG